MPILAGCLASVALSWMDVSLSEMTVEEKVGQLLIAHFHGEVANEEAKVLIEEAHVGGIIYYNWANQLSSPDQVRHLSQGLQELAQATRLGIPLFISTDQEGGVVNRLTQGLTLFPGNKALGMTKDLKLAEECAYAIGEQLCYAGVNFNFSPVVDINNNPKNPIIGIRSFGERVDEVVPFAEASLKGYKRAGIITSLKHFPGHGDVEVDSHEALPVVNKTKEEILAFELSPYKTLASQADTIMTAHVLMPAFDPKHSATLSKPILDLLRNEFHYEGVIITDSLVMEGVLKQCKSVDEAAIASFEAGCDILLLGGKQLTGSRENLELTVLDVKRIHQALVSAVKSGRIAEKRLNESVERILNLKKKSFSQPHDVVDLQALEKIHNALAAKIASLALRTFQHKQPLDLSEKTVAFIVPEIVKAPFEASDLLKLSKKTTPFYIPGLNPSQEAIQSIQELANSHEALVVFSYNAWKNPSQQKAIDLLVQMKKPLVLICLRDPLDVELFKNAPYLIATYSPTQAAFQAVYQTLSKKETP